MSPIENLWSKGKNILRSIKTTNYQELGKAIEFAFNEVTEQKYLELAQVTAVIVPHLSEKGYIWAKYSLNSKKNPEKKTAFKIKIAEYLKIEKETPERLQVWFGDESGFSLRVIRRKNWCKKGSRKNECQMGQKKGKS